MREVLMAEEECGTSNQILTVHVTGIHSCFYSYTESAKSY